VSAPGGRLPKAVGRRLPQTLAVGHDKG